MLSLISTKCYTYNKDGEHVVRHFTNDGTMTNANDTSDRDADHNWSWIDYWRAMTGIMDEPLHCSSCGDINRRLAA